MMLPDVLTPATATLTRWLVLAAGRASKAPEPEDVKAGWGALGIFALLALAVAVLGFSLVRHLRTAQLNRDSGVFGDDPKRPTDDG